SSNFDLDQSGMKKQLSQLYDILSLAVPKLAIYLDEQESGNLYFCFRWLLVLFKREFKCEEIMRLWEVLWSGLPCKNFHLLICIAILDNEKDLLIENNYGLNEILKHINDMSYQIDLDKSLSTAEAIYQQLLGLAKLPDSVRLALDIPLGTADPTQNGNGPAEQTEFLTPEHLSPVELLTMSSPERRREVQAGRMSQTVLRGFPGLPCEVRLEFQLPLPRNLACALCRAVCPVIYRAVCCHAFCERCKEELMRSRSVLLCPVDGNETWTDKIVPDDTVWNSLKDFTVLCSQSIHGCRFSDTVAALKNHIRDCPYMKKLCPLCEEEVLSKDLFSHLGSVCAKRPLACEHCGLNFHKELLNDHRTHCPERVVGCEFCGTDGILLGELALHYDECELKPWCCTMKDYGCTFEDGTIERVSYPRYVEAGLVSRPVSARGTSSSSAGCHRHRCSFVFAGNASPPEHLTAAWGW
ncbi:hypothetical protein HPB47_007725, partial [Ixodes persulcatus]